MPSASTNLSASEYAYVQGRIATDSGSISSFLRRLVQEDMQRYESEALTALSLNAMAEVQQEHALHLVECHALIHSGFKAVSDQLNELLVEQASNAEQILQAHVRLLGINEATSDLVAAALTDCRDILDATNTVVEDLERRIKPAGGKPW